MRLNHQISFFKIAAKDLVSSGNSKSAEGRRIIAFIETRGTDERESMVFASRSFGEYDNEEIPSHRA